MFPLELTPRAETDLDAAIAWYAARDRALANQFDAAVNHALSQIAEHPLRYPEFDRGVCRVLLDRFPYKYRVLSDAVVEVLSVYHGARDPDRWDAIQRD